MNLDTLFKFKVGDTVRHILAAGLNCGGHSGNDVRMYITSRYLFETDDGTTKRYSITAVTRSGRIVETGGLLQEMELVRSAPFGPEEPK